MKVETVSCRTKLPRHWCTFYHHTKTHKTSLENVIRWTIPCIISFFFPFSFFSFFASLEFRESSRHTANFFFISLFSFYNECYIVKNQRKKFAKPNLGDRPGTVFNRGANESYTIMIL